MSRVRRLNIQNTDRAFNLNLISSDEFYLNRITKSNIKKTIKKIESNHQEDSKLGSLLDERTDGKYSLDESNAYFSLIKLLFSKASYTRYFPKNSLSKVVMFEAIKNRHNSEIVFTYSDSISPSLQSSIEWTSKGARTSLLISIKDYDDFNTYSILKELFKLRYMLDRVYFDFTDSNIPDYIEYEMFARLNESMSTWKMNAYIVLDDYNREYFLKKKSELIENKEKPTGTFDRYAKKPR